MTLRHLPQLALDPRCTDLVEEAWGSVHVARKGEIVDASRLPALVLADDATGPTALAAYRPDAAGWEIVVLQSTERGVGRGTALIDALVALALDTGVDRLWLTTTNDNVDAMRFSMRRGFRMAYVHRGEQMAPEG